MRQFLRKKKDESRQDVAGYICPEACAISCSEACAKLCTGGCSDVCYFGCGSGCNISWFF